MVQGQGTNTQSDRIFVAATANSVLHKLFTSSDGAFKVTLWTNKYYPQCLLIQALHAGCANWKLSSLNWIGGSRSVKTVETNSFFVCSILLTDTSGSRFISRRKRWLSLVFVHSWGVISVLAQIAQRPRGPACGSLSFHCEISQLRGIVPERHSKSVLLFSLAR